MSKAHNVKLLLEWMREIPSIQTRLNTVKYSDGNVELYERANWYQAKGIKKTNQKKVIITKYN